MRWIPAAFLLFSSLYLAAHAAGTDDKARDEAIAIFMRIGETCETKGMEACEPNLRGMEALFDYFRAVNEMEQTEAEFVAFVRTRYSMPDFTMDKMAAHLKVKLGVEVNCHSFDGNVQQATRVPGGYDVQTKDGLTRLRLEKQTWVAYLPAEMDKKMTIARRYTFAAKLKRSIMIYRKMEAELLDYNLDEFATRFVGDLGPLAVALLQKPDMIAQMPDWQQKVQGVIDFYSQFKSVEDMRAHILASKK